MFEEYLQDADEFFESGKKAAIRKEDRAARRYFRASVFYLAGANEAFVNYIAESFEKADSLSRHEIAFLNDRDIVFDQEKGILRERIAFHRLEDKLRFLIRRFAEDFNFQSSSWSRLMAFKDFRDSLVHPRKAEDETTLEEYEKRISSGVSGIVDVMNSVSQAIFKRPLRKQLLDLIPK
jgi:hypothetical protein